MRVNLGFFKNLLPRTLFARSLLILVTPIFLVQIITTYMFFDRHWQKMGDRLAFALAGEIAVISAQLEENDSPQHFQELQMYGQQYLDFDMTYQSGAKLEHIYYEDRNNYQNPSRENVIVQTLSNAFSLQLMRPFYIKVDRDGKGVEVTVQLSRGVLQIVLPERRIFSSSGYIVLLWMAGSSMVLLIISTLFMRNQIRPIRRLAIAAERFGKGRDVPFFKIEGASEVRQASRAFVDMKERLKRQIQQKTAMLAGVSHDLRTPLTRMKLQLEMMGGGQDVKDLQNDLRDMEKMIEAYLQFARGEGDEDPVPLNLKNFLHQIVRTVNRDGEKVHAQIPDGLVLSLRPVAFERCINNLLGNALQYGAAAWVSAKKVGNGIEILIDDNGPGISPGHYDDVFKPFFRGESSRNAKTGGVGLGLPIVQDVIMAHGGEVWLGKSPQGGLRVTINLPV